MKKILFMVMGVLALSMATSCAGNKTADAVETDSATTVVDSVAQVDSVDIATDSVVVAE